MYNDAMDGIAEYLMKQTPEENLTFMGELNPQGRSLTNSRPRYVYILSIKTCLVEANPPCSEWNFGYRQEHLVCFLAGSLMLGAVTSGSKNGQHTVSVPPRPSELTERGLRDWRIGIDFLEG